MEGYGQAPATMMMRIHFSGVKSVKDPLTFVANRLPTVDARLTMPSISEMIRGCCVKGLVEAIVDLDKLSQAAVIKGLLDTSNNQDTITQSSSGS